VGQRDEFTGAFAEALRLACDRQGLNQKQLGEQVATRQHERRRRGPEREAAIEAGKRQWPGRLSAWKKGDRLPATLDELYLVLEVIGSSDPRSQWELRWRHARGELTGGLMRTPAPPPVSPAVAGRPLAEVTDPFDYEVHHAIDGPGAGLPRLPPYVRREHDRLLEAAAGRALAGGSAIAVLVGGSSTGKTRAGWEVLGQLRAGPAPWRLWHPIAPTPAEAVLAGLDRIGPRTVIWLNDAGHYLADPALGERVAASLRELLREARRAPVLILATMWTSDWDTLTARGEGEADRHANARALLGPHRIRVPDTFTGRDWDALVAAAGRDPRLGEAMSRARDGQVAQYLAGGPMLVRRFEDAPPAARALVTAAMDARRLDCGPYLSRDLLERAVPGYLTGSEAETLGPDWWPAATGYACARLHGISGMLNPVGVSFRLADYLDEFGRRQFADVVPPSSFWTAAAQAAPGDVVTLADAARARGLLRDATRLYVHATERDGCAVEQSRSSLGCAAISAVRVMDALAPDDPRPRRWAAANCSLHDPDDVADLLSSPDPETVATVLARDPASRVSLDHPWPVDRLLTRLGELGAGDQIATLLTRDPAGQVDAGHRHGVVDLLRTLHRLAPGGRAEAAAQAGTLARRAASAVTFGYQYRNSVFSALTAIGADRDVATFAARAAAEVPFTDDDAALAVACVLDELHALGDRAAIGVLLARNPAGQVHDGNLEQLAQALRRAGADGQLEVLIARITAGADAGDPGALARAAGLLSDTGRRDRIPVLLERIPAARLDLRHPAGLARLLQTLTRRDASGYVSALLARNPAAHTAIENAERLLPPLRRWGADEQCEALLRRIAQEFPLREAAPLRRLLSALQYLDTGPGRIVRTTPVPHLDLLLARDPGGQVDLADPYEVAGLIADLRSIGAAGASDRLADRAAAGAPLDDPSAVALLLKSLPSGDLVARLLARDPAARVGVGHPGKQPSDVMFLVGELRAAGAGDQADVLIRRLVAAGHFREAFGEVAGFAWGREPDGTPAGVWGWAG
jgi:hypothetical protein